MNKNFIINLSLFILFIFCYSCNNELNGLHETGQNTSEIKFSIEDARSYFESNATDLSPMILSRNITKNIGSSTLDLKPVWENAIKSGHNNVLIIEIPLQTTTQPFAQCTQSKDGKIVYQRKMISARRLIISKTATGVIDMFIATVVPSQDDKNSYAKQLNEFSYLGGGCFTGQVFCSTLEGELVKIFNYEDGENIGALQFRLKDDLTTEMKENLKGNEYMSFSFEDMVKTKIRTFSFGEIGFPDWNPDMGTVIVPGKCGICNTSPCICQRCVWCGNKRCTCPVCPRCRNKVRNCTCYQYPEGGPGVGITGGGGDGSITDPDEDESCDDIKCHNLGCGKCINPSKLDCQKCECCTHERCKSLNCGKLIRPNARATMKCNHSEDDYCPGSGPVCECGERHVDPITEIPKCLVEIDFTEYIDLNDGYIKMWEWSLFRNTEVGGAITTNNTLIVQYRDDNSDVRANRVYSHYPSQPHVYYTYTSKDKKTALKIKTDVHTHLGVDDSKIKEIVNGRDTLRGMTMDDLGSKIDDTNELKRLRVDGKIMSNYKVYSYDSLSHAQTLCLYINLK